MKYVNQAPKELAKMSAKFNKLVPTLTQVPSEWYVQPKYDGTFAMVFTTVGHTQTRTGEVQHSIPHVEAALVEAFGPGWVIFGEVWKAGWLHKDINGASRRQRPQLDLDFVVFDAVPASAFDKGVYNVPYSQRLTDLRNAIEYSPKGQPVWMHVVDNKYVGEIPCSLDQHAANLVARTDAFDGCMVRDPHAIWKAGACKEGEAIKVKVVLSLDLKIVDQHAEQRPTKLGGYFTVEYKGVRSDVGSGLDQRSLSAIMDFECHGDSPGARNYRGWIAEVECLGLTPDGKLREPRLKTFRHDTVQEELKGK